MAGGGGFDVGIEALTNAAGTLRSAGQGLRDDARVVRDRGLDAVQAIPPSDLTHAYAYCWTRWLITLEHAAEAVADAADGTVRGEQAYQSADRDAARAIDALGQP